MTLTQYLTANGLTQSDAARALGVTHSTVSRWVSGLRLPSRDQYQAIYRWTGGEVSANDFIHTDS